ncbi:hypothetical protein DL770_003645 [Monosporascus sp. CRB-9-2]|nr:hypothetical protein DL770_003645 [Monosporascus sp. CRB-9-2]
MENGIKYVYHIMTSDPGRQCSNITLDPVDQLPLTDLLGLVRRCPEICEKLYGPGDTDLVGIGVIVSYGVHLSVAILFAAVLIMERWIIPTLRPDYKRSLLYNLLDRHHDTCLWSSLVTTLSICIAGSAQVLTRSTTGAYQGFAIMQAVYVTYGSLLLVCASHHRQLKRPSLFGVGLLLTSVSAGLPFFTIASRSEGENTLMACTWLAYALDTAWKDAVITPFDTTERALGGLTCTLAALLLGCWLILRRYEEPQGAERRGRRTQTVLVLIATVLSLYFAADCTYSFVGLITVRDGMEAISDGSFGINKWGVGQIAAPLVWLPLLMDICYDDGSTSRGQRNVELDDPIARHEGDGRVTGSEREGNANGGDRNGHRETTDFVLSVETQDVPLPKLVVNPTEQGGATLRPVDILPQPSPQVVPASYAYVSGEETDKSGDKDAHVQNSPSMPYLDPLLGVGDDESLPSVFAPGQAEASFRTPDAPSSSPISRLFPTLQLLPESCRPQVTIRKAGEQAEYGTAAGCTAAPNQHPLRDCGSNTSSSRRRRKRATTYRYDTESSSENSGSSDSKYTPTPAHIGMADDESAVLRGNTSAPKRGRTTHISTEGEPTTACQEWRLDNVSLRRVTEGSETTF